VRACVCAWRVCVCACINACERGCRDLVRLVQLTTAVFSSTNYCTLASERGCRDLVRVLGFLSGGSEC
jgi:hypothetical protein